MKGIKKLSIFHFIFFFFYIFLFYLLLVAVDILLPRIPKILSSTYKESQKIIKDRQIEDTQFLNKINNEKLKYIYTQDYNLYPLKNFVKKHDIIPLGTLPYSDLILCSEGYGVIKIKTDRFGFRNSDSIWTSKDIQTVVIGDSATDGQCLQEEFSIVGILNKKGHKTLRLAQGGYSSIHYAFMAKIFLPVIKPKNLVMIFHENDYDVIDMNEYHYKFFFKKNTSDYIDFVDLKPYPSEKLKSFNGDLINFISEKKNNKFTIYDVVITNFDKMHKYFFLSNIKKNFLSLTNPKKLLGSNSLAIDTAIDICKNIKCNTYFVLLRTSDYWDPQYKFYYENYKTSLKIYLKKYNKELITFDDIIDYKDKKNFSPKGPHGSIEFNKIVEKKINNALNLTDGYQ
jgi:hypothetical protein